MGGRGTLRNVAEARQGFRVSMIREPAPGGVAFVLVTAHGEEKLPNIGVVSINRIRELAAEKVKASKR